MARTYIPTLVAQLERLERYIERYDTVLIENMTSPEITALNTLLAAIKAQLAVTG